MQPPLGANSLRVWTAVPANFATVTAAAVAAAGFMHGMLPLLDANLPRVWTAVPDSVGLAEPVAPAISHGHPGRTGGDYDGAAIMAHMDTLER